MICTLKKQERLKRGDFRGAPWTKCSETAHFVLLAAENGYGIKRFAVTIRKRTGVAAVRNRVKRIVKEFFRLHKDLFREDSNSLIRVKGLPESLTMGSVEPELLALLSSTKRRTSTR
jgi:ribonuclease P protein component